MLAVALGTGVIAVSASYFSAHLAGKFGHHLRIKLFNKIQELAISSFENMVHQPCLQEQRMTSITFNKS